MTIALQGLATAIPLPDATVLVLGVAAVLTVIIGLARGRAVAHWLPATLFVLLGASWFWSWFASPSPAMASRRSAIVWAAVVALVVHVVATWRDEAAVPTDERASWAPASYLAIAVLVAAALMFHDLPDYAGTLQRWEASVLYGFGLAFRAGIGLAQYAEQQLRWNNGILSLGAQSYLFGVPTYALFHVAGFSTWTLRVLAVVGMLANVVVIFVLARRFFGPVAAAGAATALALDDCALFYGRYGSSPAGTMLAAMLAVFCAWLFLERDRPPWWSGLACVATLYLATLQYAVARIVILLILAFIPLVFVFQWRRLSVRRVVGAAVIYAGAVAVWFLQGFAGQQVFLMGQGEHFFYMTKFPDYVASFCPTCAQLLPDQTAYQMALLRRWLANTIPQYLDLVGPYVGRVPLRDWSSPVLPHLYYGPVLVLIALGIAQSLRRWWRSVPHAFLLVWTAGATVPILLASRVDSHRMMLFVVPLSLWAGIGAAEAATLMTRAGVPRALQHVFAAALCLTVVAYDVRLLWAPGPGVPRSSRVLAEEIERVPGPVVVGALIDPPNDTTRDFEFADLTLLERQRRDPHRTGGVVPYQLLTKLRDKGASPDEADITELEHLTGTATLVLAPAATFRGTAEALQQRGVRVSQGGAPDFALLRLEPGEAAASTH